MEIWTVVISMWLTTWAMAVGRTYSLIVYMVGDYEGGDLWIMDESGSVELKQPCAMRGYPHLRRLAAQLLWAA